MLPNWLNFTTSSPLYRRGIAALGVALVLLLTAAGANPLVHEHLHDGAADELASDHTCAVVLFASGVTVAVAAFALAPRVGSWSTLQRPAPAKLFLCPPRYLRQPERGPPVS